MPKVDVILTHNVVGLGAESDQVKVAAGYARNYLIPHRMAIPLSASNKRRLESLKQRRAEREAHELNSMMDLSKTLSKLVLKLVVKTGEEGKMYGSVTAGTISDELKNQFDVNLDKRKVHLDKPIRILGDHEVELRLHSEVTTTLKVHIESTTPLVLPETVPGVKAPESSGSGKGESRKEAPRAGKKESGPEPKKEPAKEKPDRKAKPAKTE